MLKHVSIRIALVFALCLGVVAVMAQTVPSTGKATPAKAEKQVQQAALKPTTSKTEDQGAQQTAEALTAAFNRGKASEVAALFLPDAEFTDDAGNLHKAAVFFVKGFFRN
jgi:predicted negative regulator of RcsB-dependent stress response